MKRGRILSSMRASGGKRLHLCILLIAAALAQLSFAASSRLFCVSISPQSETIVAGGTASYAITVCGNCSNISISVSRLPSGAAASITGTGTSNIVLSIATATTIRPGTYVLTITVTCGSLSKSGTVTLTVTEPTS